MGVRSRFERIVAIMEEAYKHRGNPRSLSRTVNNVGITLRNATPILIVLERNGLVNLIQTNNPDCRPIRTLWITEKGCCWLKLARELISQVSD